MYFLIEQEPKTGSRYQVRLMNDNNQILLISELFTAKVDCLTCIRNVKRTALEADNYILWDIDQHRFNLFYGEGLMMGAVRYKTPAERDTAISLSRLAIFEAKVIDRTEEFRQAA